MLKYLLVLPAVAVGLFLGALLAFWLVPDADHLGTAFAAGCGIGAGRLVYGYFRKRDLKNQHHIEGPAMLQTDINNFRKVFGNLDCASLGITEVKFMERADQTSFFVGLRSADFNKLDLEVIRKALYKMYYSHVQFEFIDLNSPNDEQLNEKGIAIPVKETAA